MGCNTIPQGEHQEKVAKYRRPVCYPPVARRFRTARVPRHFGLNVMVVQRRRIWSQDRVVEC
jgi:hypothetical protein